MISDTDAVELAWLAGIIEGEGCFYVNKKTKSPLIRVKMGDRDVVEKVSKMWRVNVNFAKDGRRNHSDMYTATVYGHLALDWMKKVYPMMGARRKAKILEILDLCGNKYDNTVPRKKSKTVGTK